MPSQLDCFLGLSFPESLQKQATDLSKSCAVATHKDWMERAAFFSPFIVSVKNSHSLSSWVLVHPYPWT